VSGLAAGLVASLALTGFAGVVSVSAGWAPVRLAHLGALGAASVGLLVGYVFGVLAMRTGEIGFVQPFRYTLLIWAMLFGIVMFNEWPDGWMLIGSAVVVATGLFTFYRERQLGLAHRG
jgi:drug/metabolite transporter (DMT)-like permease